MKIEAGKYYRTRDGRIIGPMQEASRDTEKWKFWALGFGEGNPCWTAEGRWSAVDDTHPMNLISEVYVSDTPLADGANKFQNCTVGTYAPDTKTLRDEFAMAALPYCISEYRENRLSQYAACHLAYDWAAAMMEARKK